MPWLFFLFIFIANVNPQTWRQEKDSFLAEVTFSETNVPILNTFTVTLKLQYPTTHHVDPIQLQEHLLDHSVLIPAPFKVVSSENKDDKVFTFVLRALSAGNFPLTFQNITFLPKNPGTEPVTLISDIVEINVLDSPAASFTTFPLLPISLTVPLEVSQENQLGIIYNPTNLSAEAERNQLIWQQHQFPWLNFLLAILAISLFFIIRYGIALLPKEVETEEQRTSRLRQEALTQLSQAPKDSVKCYLMVSDVVRKMLEAQYKVSAFSQDTRETLSAVSSIHNISESTRQQLVTLLSVADQVKFARYQPSSEECQKAVSLAKRMFSS